LRSMAGITLNIWGSWKREI